MNHIRDNLEEIKKNIESAKQRSHVKIDHVELIGVTKTIDTGRISQLLDLGVTNIGENKVQELMDKYPTISQAYPGCQWHLIGHLQTNKVKYIIDKVALIHSVESVKLAEEINKRAEKTGKVQDILVEVNIGKEESKFGVYPEDVENFVDKLKEYNHITVKGLMTVAPFVENPEENREYFKKMFQLFIDIDGKSSNNIDMKVLSMGMSNDYMVAIEEGATMVRIGTGIFGARIYKNK